MIFALSSCSYLIKETQYSYDNLPLIADSTRTSCQASEGQRSYAGEHDSSIEVFHAAIERISRQETLSSTDEFVLWSLFQMNIRPESSSPSSRLQALVFTNGEWSYWDVSPHPENSRPEQLTLPYLFGLQEILAKSKSKYQLSTLARLLERNLPQSIPVGPHFSRFLDQNKKEILRNDVFSSTLYKAQEALRAEETVARLPFEQIIRRSRETLRQKTDYRVLTQLFSAKRSEAEVHCNFDFNIYDHGVFLISLEPVTGAHPFSFSSRDGSLFLGASSQKTNLRKNLFDSFLFDQSGHHPPLSFCFVNGDQSNYGFMSLEGRDMAQMLYQIIDPLTSEEQSRIPLNERLREARHIKLYNPDRILIESHRMARQERERKSEQGVPVYHAKSIGKVWAAKLRSERTRPELIIDPRDEGYVSCP